MNQDREARPIPFDFDSLRSWSKQELLDWIEDGQYGEFIMDPPMQQPDPEGRRKAVKIVPRTRADRERKRANLVPIWEFHAAYEISAAYRRLKAKGHRNPRNKTALLTEMMRHAGPDWLDIYTKVLEKRLPDRPARPPEAGTAPTGDGRLLPHVGKRKLLKLGFRSRVGASCR